MNYFTKYLISIIVGFLLGVSLIIKCSPEKERIDIPINIDVPIPIVKVQFDTIKDPYPVYVKGDKVIDSLYYDKYISLKDSISRDSLFKLAIAINEYEKVIEDDTIAINFYAKVRGTLQSYQIGYETKRKFVKLDTVLKGTSTKSSELYYGLGVTSPINEINIQNIGLGPSASFINNKHTKLYSGYYDFINNEVNFKLELRF